VTPSIAMLMLWIMLFDPQWGLINAGLAAIGISPGPGWLSSKQWAMPAMILISVWGIGGTMVVFLAGLQGVPESLYEAAELDGANALRKMLHITIPLITPVIFFNVIMGVIRAFQVFAAAFVMTDGGPAYATFVYVLYLYNQAFLYFRMGIGSAMAWILLLILLVFTYVMFKRSTWVYYEAG
jgi:multiple sugar transport system permease protein